VLPTVFLDSKPMISLCPLWLGVMEECVSVRTLASDGLLHDAWPHDALSLTPRDRGEERWGGSGAHV